MNISELIKVLQVIELYDTECDVHPDDGRFYIKTSCFVDMDEDEEKIIHNSAQAILPNAIFL